MRRLTVVVIALGLALGTGQLADADTIYLDADTVATGSELATGTRTLDVKPYGPWGPTKHIYFPEGTITSTWNDPEFAAAGASGNVFNITQSSGQNQAKMTFDFDVEEVRFIYGGGGGYFEIFGLDGNENPIPGITWKADTGNGDPAGPRSVLSTGPPIQPWLRGILWQDEFGNRSAYMDNVVITPVGWLGGPFPVPEPSSLVLLLLSGGALAAFGRRRRNR